MTIQTKTNNQSFVDVSIIKNARFAEVTFKGGITREILDNSFYTLIKHINFKFNMNAYYVPNLKDIA